jgi:uncharacterized repeat protein (TIGR01451 family)
MKDTKMTRKRLGLLAAVGLVTLFYPPSAAVAQVSPSLGNAATYSVLAGTQVTNVGITIVSADIGISPGAGAPGTNTPGYPTIVHGGTLHDADVQAGLAMGDKNTAYTALGPAAQPCPALNNFGGGVKELAGVNLVPGVYCAGSFHLTGGTLTLTGTASDVWIFQSASDIIVTGGAAARVISPSCNVWWRAVSSVSLDALSTFTGNILADTSITLAAGASLTGRALARTGNVTLSSNAVTSCIAPLAPTPTPTPVPIPAPVCTATRPELFIVKNHTDQFVAGANANYRITLFNAGAASSGPIAVTDTLPAGMTIVVATGVGWVCTAAGQLLTCTTQGPVAAAGPHPNAITLTVRPDATAVPSVINTAQVTGGGDCDAANNVTSDLTLVSAAAPIPVPTLSQWAFLMLAILLGAAGVLAIRKRPVWTQRD